MFHKLPDVLVICSIRCIQYRLVVFCKQVERIFLAQVIELRERKDLGTSLVLCCFIVGLAIFKGRRLMLIVCFYKCYNLFERKGIGS